MEHIIKSNQAETPSIHKTGFLYGCFTALAMIIYFTIMLQFRLIEYTGFRYVNYLFIGLGIWLAYKNMLNKIHSRHLPYLQSIFMGLWIAGSGGLIFAVFVAIYAGVNPGFLPLIATRIAFDGVLTPFMAAFLVFAESFVIGIVWTLILMQYYKREDEKEA